MTFSKDKILGAVADWLDKFMTTDQDDSINTPATEVTKSINDEERMAMFVVLAPEKVDEHGDIYSAEAIEKACNNFNETCMKANLFHRVQTDTFKIIQSYISPATFKTDAGVEIQKGTWLTWVHVENDQVWSMIKSGDINGVSIRAKAREVPV